MHQQGSTGAGPAGGRAHHAGPGAAEKVTLTGKYSGANPLPVEFRLGDAACGVRVSGVAGSAPSTPRRASATTTKAPPGAKGPAAPVGGDSVDGQPRSRKAPAKPKA